MRVIVNLTPVVSDYWNDWKIEKVDIVVDIAKMKEISDVNYWDAEVLNNNYNVITEMLEKGMQIAKEKVNEDVEIYALIPNNSAYFYLLTNFPLVKDMKNMGYKGVALNTKENRQIFVYPI